MKNLLTLALLATLTANGFAQQQVRPLMNVDAREQMSLDGEWNTICDPYGHGGWRGNWGFGRDLKFTGERLQDYDFDTSSTLHVPGDWNTQQERYYLYEGTMWYRRTFQAPAVKGKRLFLHFDAANYEALVWLNGRQIGEHVGGFTPFAFDITDAVKAGENSVVVRVNNNRQPDGIPTMNTDWWNYGGITRHVRLIETPETFIHDYALRIENEKTKRIVGYVQVDGKDKAGQTVTVSIPELKLQQKLKTNDQGRAVIQLNGKKLQLWSPENPKLYAVNLTVAAQPVLKDEIGFRTVRTVGSKILLNGKETFMAGVNMHEEQIDRRPAGTPGLAPGRAYTREQDSVLLALAKELGCNLVRLAHYPHNEDMVKLADKMGLLVWSEIPLYWSIDWKNEKTYNLAVNQLTEMIDRDRNRASVIFWSIANETAVNKERTAFLTKLANEARRQDPTRLICAALQNMNKQLAHNVYTVEDPLHEALDVFSFNEYIGWYDGPKELCDSITWSLPEDKPVIISEFGGGAKIGRTGSVNHFFTEDYMTELYRHQFVMLSKIKGLAGTIPWVLADFRSPHRLIPGVQDDYNRKGLYSERGEKKRAWHIVKAWNEQMRK